MIIYLSSDSSEDSRMTETRLPSAVIDLTVNLTGQAEKVEMLENAFNSSDASSQCELREMEVNILSFHTHSAIISLETSSCPNRS
jgi:hypothetical protein